MASAWIALALRLDGLPFSKCPEMFRAAGKERIARNGSFSATRDGLRPLYLTRSNLWR